MTQPSTTSPATQDRRAAAVYRLYGASDELLYVGSAYDPAERCKEHRRQPWWGEVVRRVDEWHLSRGHAYEAEMRAIAADEPRCNVMGTEAYREKCSRLAREEGPIRQRNRAGSAAALGAPPEVVQAIRHGRIESWAAWKASGKPPVE
ncbi:hypothetical protein [Streptomyces sp. NBC_01233]|uniref:hypothetical protein n=1 Tax=Streptomyces sp. NBC_01233 TaxID=2903787 RepID=UPI002E12D81B|nr:hypothetical protein OG332_10615 [Streptomyces sp. NBC_01233]